MAIAGGDLTARNDILRTMNEEQGFRKTGTTGTAVGTNNIPSDASPSQTDDFSMLEPREQLRRLIAAENGSKPFCELAGVTFDHRGALSSVTFFWTRLRRTAIPSMILTPSVR